MKKKKTNFKQKKYEQEPSPYCKTCLALMDKNKLTPEEFKLFKGCRCERRYYE